MGAFMSKLEGMAKSVWAFGRKNAPSLMIGGSVVMGWSAVYVFWRQSKKAEKKIQVEEEKLKEQTALDKVVVLPPKEKAIIYLQYCWPSLLMGLASSGRAIGAHKIELSRLAEAYVMAQFFEKKSEDQENLVSRLKGELGTKKSEKVENEIFEEKHPQEQTKREFETLDGTGRTMFIDVCNFENKFRGDIEDMRDAIYRANQILQDRLDRKAKRILGDAFFSQKDSPYPELEIYVEMPLIEFMQIIGETKTHQEDCMLGNCNVIRMKYGADGLDPNEIMDFKRYRDPQTGVPPICYLNYGKYLRPSTEYIENDPE